MAKSKPKVGLALGGGYARGLAHIGILEVFERERIPVDLIAGTSMGALVGALYARERDASLIKKQAAALDWIGVTSLVDLAIPKSGFIGGKRVINLLRRFLGDARFEDLDIPFSCVATDIIRGEEVIIDKGPVVEGVRASISIPLIFSVVKRDGRYLVDGGLVNQVPISIARQMGADFVIAVDISSGTNNAPPQTTMETIIQSVVIMYSKISLNQLARADVVIRPKVSHIGSTDFSKRHEAVLEGEKAALEAMPQIKAALDKLRAEGRL